MNLVEKAKNCQNFLSDIDIPNYAKHEKNLFCDFIELVSFFSIDKTTSIGDIQDRFFGVKDYNSPKNRDDDENWLIEVFELIHERKNSYNDSYPFTFSEDFVLELKNELSWKNKLYLTLLISSKLNIFSEFKKELTDDFESFSFHTLRNFLPANSEIREFGKNSDYIGNAKEKIKTLAKEIGLNIDEYELSGISERNYQERGLDIIGWIPFDDNCFNRLIFLCQCACGKNTESKYHDTRRFENYFEFYKIKPQHIMFVPYSLLNTSEKKFYHSDLIEKDFLIFERKRIIDKFKDEQVFKDSDTIDILNALINVKEDIV